MIRDHFVYASSQRKTVLHCNAISHWLEAHTEWSLCDHPEFAEFIEIFVDSGSTSQTWCDTVSHWVNRAWSNDFCFQPNRINPQVIWLKIYFISPNTIFWFHIPHTFKIPQNAVLCYSSDIIVTENQSVQYLQVVWNLNELAHQQTQQWIFFMHNHLNATFTNAGTI